MSLYKNVYKITDIKDYDDSFLPPAMKGVKTLVFGEVNSQTHALGYWIAANQPKIGGYFAHLKAGGAAYLESYGEE